MNLGLLIRRPGKTIIPMLNFKIYFSHIRRLIYESSLLLQEEGGL